MGRGAERARTREAGGTPRNLLKVDVLAQGLAAGVHLCLGAADGGRGVRIRGWDEGGSGSDGFTQSAHPAASKPPAATHRHHKPQRPIGHPARTLRMATRPCTSGRSTVIWRSKRPGRSSAESSTSGRLVAASTMTPVLPSKPSISACGSGAVWLWSGSAVSERGGAGAAGRGEAGVAQRCDITALRCVVRRTHPPTHPTTHPPTHPPVSSWLMVCSRSSLPPPMPAPRWRPTASISSMKMMQGALPLACAETKGEAAAAR